MHTYRDPNGDEYTIRAGEECQLISLLRKTMFTDPGSDLQYKHRVGNLVAEQYGVWLDTDDDKKFLEGLIDLGIMKRVK